MNEAKHSEAFLRKRKMLLVLPVLVIPFLTLAFWSLGGGKGDSYNSTTKITVQGLNLQLPDAHFKDDKALNKLSYYEKAAYDSAKKEELLKNDPYFKIPTIRTRDSSANLPDTNEQKVYEKLAALDKELNKKNSTIMEDDMKSVHNNSPSVNTENVDRLERMMTGMQQTSPVSDPEMNQLNGMLDKIMDIQHPERLTNEIKNNSLQHKEKVFPVSLQQPRNNMSLLVSEESFSSKIDTLRNSFYTVAKDQTGISEPNAVEAVIHETRTIVNGSIVKVRLVSDVYINGTLIPSGTFVYGKASLNGERLNIEINSIHYKNSLFPVSLIVYDMDGMDGVFIPGAITRDVAKESTDRAIQGIALSSLDPSIGAQAASAGIEAAKNLLTKKVKLIKVVVKAGYKVLLKDKK